MAASPGRANFLTESFMDLLETWQRVELPLDQQSSVIWYKADEPFLYNNNNNNKIWLFRHNNE